MITVNSYRLLSEKYCQSSFFNFMGQKQDFFKFSLNVKTRFFVIFSEKSSVKLLENHIDLMIVHKLDTVFSSNTKL